MIDPPEIDQTDQKAVPVMSGNRFIFDAAHQGFIYKAKGQNLRAREVPASAGLIRLPKFPSVESIIPSNRPPNDRRRIRAVQETLAGIRGRAYSSGNKTGSHPEYPPDWEYRPPELFYGGLPTEK